MTAGLRSRAIRMIDLSAQGFAGCQASSVTARDAVGGCG